MKNPLIWIVIAVIVIAAGAYFLTRSPEAPAAADNMTGDDTPIPVEPPGFETGGATGGDTSGGIGEPLSAYTVRYTADGFSPSTITVPEGTTVTFVNQSSRDMWVASDQHPSHTGYSGTSRTEHCPGGSMTAFDQCAKGASYSFTFEKTGIWSYHDHMNAQFKGTVIVE